MCEFITGGGFIAAPLPKSLANEGAAMRDALLRDLAALNAFNIMCMHDARLAFSALNCKTLIVKAGDDFNQVFKQALNQVDYVWLIAPETNATLRHLGEIVYASGAQLLGCGHYATVIGTSKIMSFNALTAANINTLAVFSGEVIVHNFAEVLQLKVAKWVAKPENGAGCEGIKIFADLHALCDWIKQDDQYLQYFAQPYQLGIAASFCMLCRDGHAWLLSSNQQHIDCDGDTFKLKSITLNGMKTYANRFEIIAEKIAKMLPDALGYMGIDVIIDTETNSIFVLDINPRLTTSYVGLAQAIAYNPAQLILDCVLKPHFKMPALQQHIVTIHV